MMDTLGDMQKRGEAPTEVQVFMLELEASKRCRAFNYPHRHHCQQLSNDQTGQLNIQRIVCWELETLWRNLEEMFPGIVIDKN